MIGSDRRMALALGAAALLLVPGSARADADKPLGSSAMAEALFKEAKELLKRGKVPEACRKLEGSYRIDPAPGTLLNLALCHEKEGKTASAWGELNESLQIAKKTNRKDREKIAREHIAAIEPKLSRFVVAVPAEAQVNGLVVEMDGVPLEKGAWGTAIPIDPGEHAAVAKAPKYRTWESKLTVEEAKVATLLVPKLERVPDAKPPEPAGQWKKPVGYSMLGVSAVLLGLGTVFGVRAMSLGNETADGCKNMVCNEAGWEALQSGRSSATAANVLLPIGLAAAGVGAFFLITAPRSTDGAPSSAGKDARIEVRAGAVALPGGGYLGVGGAF
ncbi:tetratricopeptide repeat protein [Polyangium aurulentum]|uniref:tetratricopeptide repeat protein n=1 Tax=Polyangium aurulentum TaxID=2567896 RepID=UPI0010AEA732|nr:tetratricopeptide repeat protein [Polyangium aurulentum]UQA62194.1 tetratricopeptide repeat protein [Polyangium aurulentum]